MKVLHVINSLSGSGGAEHGLVREVVRFDSETDQVVARLYPPNQLGTTIESAGIGNVHLGLDSSRSGWNWPLGVARLRRLINEFQPDVVHSSLASANLVAELATVGGVPVLSTFTLSGDTTLVRRYQPGAGRRRAALVRKISGIAARSDHVWFRAITADALRTNCDALGVQRSRAIVIPRGVPTPDASPAPTTRTDLGLPSTRPLILNVGRQTAQKGHGQLLRAFARIRAERDAHLVILGREGDGTSELLATIEELELGHHVSVIPYADNTYDYYQAADVFVFPSLMEGLGTAVLEAMACGLPVVAYEIPPVREVTNDGRYAKLVPVGDIDGLSSAVLSVLDDPAHAERQASEATAHVTANYSLEATARRLEECLVKVAEGGGVG